MKRLALCLLLLLVACAAVGDSAPPEKKYYATVSASCLAPQRLVESIAKQLRAESIAALGAGDITYAPFVQAPDLQTKMVPMGIHCTVNTKLSLTRLQSAHVSLMACFDDLPVTDARARLILLAAPTPPPKSPQRP